MLDPALMSSSESSKSPEQDYRAHSAHGTGTRSQKAGAREGVTANMVRGTGIRERRGTQRGQVHGPHYTAIPTERRARRKACNRNGHATHGMRRRRASLMRHERAARNSRVGNAKWSFRASSSSSASSFRLMEVDTEPRSQTQSCRNR